MESRPEKVSLAESILSCGAFCRFPWIYHKLVSFETGAFKIRMDFFHNEITLKTSSISQDRFPLGGKTAISFYELMMEKLKFLGIQVKIKRKPHEMSNVYPFSLNKKKLTYQANAAQKIRKMWIHIHMDFSAFQSKLIGNCSPVHFFLGSFDIANTCFSRKRAVVFEVDVLNIPKAVMQKAYSYELFSMSCWVGIETFPTPYYYPYGYSNYSEFKYQFVQPKDANWSEESSGYLLPYEVIHKSSSLESPLQAFLQTTYEAASKMGDWDRENLDSNFSYLVVQKFRAE
jgi:hypothetical protein